MNKCIGSKLPPIMVKVHGAGGNVTYTGVGMDELIIATEYFNATYEHNM